MKRLSILATLLFALACLSTSALACPKDDDDDTTTSFCPGDDDDDDTTTSFCPGDDDDEPKS